MFISPVLRRRSLPRHRRYRRSVRGTITVVGCHAGGEVGNVVVAGVDPPPGATVYEQMQALRADDSLRRFLLREPRGSVATHANLIVPATRADCAFGYVIMEPTEYPAMSGSNTICVATVLLETGMVELQEPETVVRLEAPAGVVEVRCVLPRRPCRERGARRTCRRSPRTSMRRSRSMGSGRSPSTSRSAACGTRSPTRRHSASSSCRREARDLCQVGEMIRVAAREQLVRSPGEPGRRRRLDRADRAAVAGRRRGDAQRGRHRAGTARPLGDRHWALGAARDAARARADARRRRDDARVADRLHVRRPDRGRDDRRRPAGDRAGDSRQRVHHRQDRAVRRRARPVPGGLPP